MTHFDIIDAALESRTIMINELNRLQAHIDEMQEAYIAIDRELGESAIAQPDRKVSRHHLCGLFGIIHTLLTDIRAQNHEVTGRPGPLDNDNSTPSQPTNRRDLLHDVLNIIKRLDDAMDTNDQSCKLRERVPRRDALLAKLEALTSHAKSSRVSIEV